MELRHLRYFVAAAEEENITRAASKLHLSQPALSRQIRDLEEHLGFPVFDRAAQSLRLTDAGRVLLREARAVLDHAAEAVEKARAAATGRTSELHAGYAPSLTARLLPAALRDFQKRFPKTRVKLHDLSTAEMLQGLRQGQLQLAFTARPTPRMLRGFLFEELLQDPVGLAVAPTHRLARARSITLSDFASEPLIAYSHQEYPEARALLETIFARSKSKPRILEEHDSVSGLISSVESGAGVAVVTESLLCTAGQRLKILPFLPPAPPLPVGAIWRKDHFPPEAAEFLRSAKQGVRK